MLYCGWEAECNRRLFGFHAQPRRTGLSRGHGPRLRQAPGIGDLLHHVGVGVTFLFVLNGDRACKFHLAEFTHDLGDVPDTRSQQNILLISLRLYVLEVNHAKTRRELENCSGGIVAAYGELPGVRGCPHGFGEAGDGVPYFVRAFVGELDMREVVIVQAEGEPCLCQLYIDPGQDGRGSIAGDVAGSQDRCEADGAVDVLIVLYGPRIV